MQPLSQPVLQMFKDMKRDALDLHVMFEAAGNDPAKRQDVLDAVEELQREGFLVARGSDFYALTEKGDAPGNARGLGSRDERKRIARTGSRIVPQRINRRRENAASPLWRIGRSISMTGRRQNLRLVFFDARVWQG